MKLNIEELILQSNDTAKLALDGSLHEGFDRERMKAFARRIVERCAQEAESLSLVYASLEGYNPRDYRTDAEQGIKDTAAAIRNLMED